MNKPAPAKVPPPTRDWKPLKAYTLPRAEERQKYASLPSQYQGAA